MRDGGCGVGWDEVGWHGGRMGGGYCNRGGEQVGCVTELYSRPDGVGGD